MHYAVLVSVTLVTTSRAGSNTLKIKVELEFGSKMFGGLKNILGFKISFDP